MGDIDDLMISGFILEFAQILSEIKKYVLKDQILKSGTSVEANVREAQNAESRTDFIHKFKVAAKEADELEYWLLLSEYSEKYPFSQFLIDSLSL
ncbi:MAG: four helix bundle protein [Chitinophagales bacterium]